MFLEYREYSGVPMKSIKIITNQIEICKILQTQYEREKNMKEYCSFELDSNW